MNEFERYLKQKQDDLEVKFTFVILSTLALSLQFQADSTKSYKLWLVGSWTLITLSALLSGYRLLHTLPFEKHSHDLRQLLIATIGLKRKHSPTTLEIEDLKQKKEKISNLRSVVNDIEVKINRNAKPQIICYLLGLLTNLIFVILNFL